MRIADQFAVLNERNEAALVLFVTGGDPSLEALPDICEALQDAGADLIEIGVPFTDPIADGPVIQASSQRALDRGVKPGMVLDTLSGIEFRVPVILMGYYNTALRVGLPEYAKKLRAAGASGTIMCDLIPEEAGDWISASQGADLDTVFLAAPTSNFERRKAVCDVSTGFVYAVSRMGVTGVGTSMGDSTEGLVGSLKELASCPVCVGFGVSTPEDVKRVSGIADGAIVGSWLVDRLARDWDNNSARAELLADVRRLKEATRR
ncbi:MAG: tryptophan synthase subunit alpha [Fimbriimonadaceae bacterium]